MRFASYGQAGVEEFAGGLRAWRESPVNVPSFCRRVRSRRFRRSSKASEGSSAVISLTRGRDRRCEMRLS